MSTGSDSISSSPGERRSHERPPRKRPPRKRPPRKRRWARVVLAQLVVVLLAIPLTEIGFRIAASARGRPHDSDAARAELEDLQSANQDFTPRPRSDRQLNERDNPHAAPVLHPYFGFDVMDGSQILGDQLRFVNGDRDPERIDILIVGGSVADMFGQEEYGAGPLRELLAADPRIGKRNIHFLQFGRGGYKEPQQINEVVYLLGLGFRPRAVVNIDGFNEVALGNANASKGTHPTFPSAAHWAHLANWGAVDRDSIDIIVRLREKQRSVERLVGFALDHGFYRSAALTQLSIARLHKLRNECERELALYTARLDDPSQRAVSHGPAFSGDSTWAVTTSVRVWGECSRMLQEICAAHSILYLHVLQPTLHDVGSKKLTQREVDLGSAEKAWIEGVHLGYPMLRAFGERLKQQGVEFVDASQIFAGETGDIYFDCCHFGERGNKLLAQKIATELLARWDRAAASSTLQTR